MHLPRLSLSHSPTLVTNSELPKETVGETEAGNKGLATAVRQGRPPGYPAASLRGKPEGQVADGAQGAHKVQGDNVREKAVNSIRTKA